MPAPPVATEAVVVVEVAANRRSPVDQRLPVHVHGRRPRLDHVGPGNRTQAAIPRQSDGTPPANRGTAWPSRRRTGRPVAGPPGRPTSIRAPPPTTEPPPRHRTVIRTGDFPRPRVRRWARSRRSPHREGGWDEPFPDPWPVGSVPGWASVVSGSGLAAGGDGRGRRAGRRRRAGAQHRHRRVRHRHGHHVGQTLRHQATPP